MELEIKFICKFIFFSSARNENADDWWIFLWEILVINWSFTLDIIRFCIFAITFSFIDFNLNANIFIFNKHTCSVYARVEIWKRFVLFSQYDLVSIRQFWKHYSSRYQIPAAIDKFSNLQLCPRVRNLSKYSSVEDVQNRPISYKRLFKPTFPSW